MKSKQNVGGTNLKNWFYSLLSSKVIFYIPNSFYECKGQNKGKITNKVASTKKKIIIQSCILHL